MGRWTTLRVVSIGAAVGTAALAAALLSGRASGAAASPTLKASVGPGFSISLTNANGVRITHLIPGSYVVDVNDQSAEHNFHLSGPAVNQATSIGAVEKKTWNVTFKNGTYKFVCDAHPTQMTGSFTVGTKPVVLTGIVGPSNKITLTRNKKVVKSLKAGSYVVKVFDRSAKLNFHLYGPGKVALKTGLKFMGKLTWKVKVRKGTYFYRSDVGKGLKKSFKVV